MVEHIVLFKMKPQSTPAEKEELIRRLRGLSGKIDGIVDLSAGETFTDRHKGYTVGLVVRFTDKEALERYGPHRACTREGVRRRVCDDVIAVDYEIG